MKHVQKIEWMAIWAVKNNLKLELKGECGFARPCVGVTSGDTYPDYHWYDKDFNRLDNNGKVWTPEDAYHKHECVAVLGHGEDAESQLYDWLKWFDEHDFKLETGDKPVDPSLGTLAFLLGLHKYARMVRQSCPDDGAVTSA